MQPTLLDADILSEIIKQRNPGVQTRAANYLQQHGSFAFSALTRYEVLRWLISKNAQQQIARFYVFCQNSVIYPITDDVLNRAADLWVLGRRGGHPTGDADIIVAATAMLTQRELATGNTSHYAWIPGLLLVNWRQVSTP